VAFFAVLRAFPTVFLALPLASSTAPRSSIPRLPDVRSPAPAGRGSLALGLERGAPLSRGKPSELAAAAADFLALDLDRRGPWRLLVEERHERARLLGELSEQHRGGELGLLCGEVAVLDRGRAASVAVRDGAGGRGARILRRRMVLVRCSVRLAASTVQKP
jgi:hypothetical protein